MAAYSASLGWHDTGGFGRQTARLGGSAVHSGLGQQGCICIFMKVGSKIIATSLMYNACLSYVGSNRPNFGIWKLEVNAIRWCSWLYVTVIYVCYINHAEIQSPKD